MITTYLKAKDKAALELLRSCFINVMEPVQGAAAYEDAESGLISAKGDPAYWYTSILAPVSISAFGGIEACDETEGVLVCGVWA